MTRFTALVLPLVFGSLCHAQPVHFRGKVEDVGGNQFIVACTSTKLTSGTLNLQDYVGLQVEAKGNWNGLVTTPTVDVTAAAVVARTFEVGGNGKIGGDLIFAVTSTPGDFTVMLLAPGPSFIPSTERGVFFLDPRPLLKIGSGIVPGTGTLEVKVSVPNDPTLVGLAIHGQAAIVPQTGNTFYSNPDCKTLSS